MRRFLCFCARAFGASVVLLIFLTSCDFYNDVRRVLSREAGQLTDVRCDHAAGGTDYIFTLLVERRGIAPALHEPPSGAYLGINIDDDRFIGDISAFNRLAGRNHPILATSMNLDDAVPSDKILMAAVLEKALLLTIHPPAAAPREHAKTEYITRIAREVGRFSLPVFINFYPYSAHHNFEPEAYKNLFRQAARIFDGLAPSAAMVWSINIWDYETSAAFYPGVEYADWVGAEITAHINRHGAYDDFFTLFEMFAEEYQNESPIIITGLSISNFTSRDNTYRTDLAAAYITEFYSRLEHWPRVKAVVYHGVSGPECSSLKAIESVLAAYKNAIQSGHFLSSVKSRTETTLEDSRSLITYRRSARMQNGSIRFAASVDRGIIRGRLIHIDHDRHLVHLLLNDFQSGEQ